jgi:hypothetical protein
MSRYSHFGAGIGDVLRRLPGALAADFALRFASVGTGSTESVLILDSTVGLAPGDAVNVTGQDGDPTGETRVVHSVDSPTQVTLEDPLSAAPVSGDMVNSGPSTILAALDDAQARVEAHLPDRYRRMLTRVEGELIVPQAEPSQSQATLALGPATTLVLYDNYRGQYADRSPDDAMGTSTYSLDADGVTVHFSPPLAAGARIAADYEHELTDGVGVLADLVAELAAARLARFVLGHQPDFVQALLAEADQRLDALAAGRTAVPELDAVRLYEDWEHRPGGIRAGALDRR